MEVSDSVCDSGQNDILQERSTPNVVSDDQDHAPCNQLTEMISSTSSSSSSSNSSFHSSNTNSLICLPLSPFISNACNVDVKTLVNQENYQESSNYFTPKLDNFKNSDKLQDENSNLIASNHGVPISEDIDEKADRNDDEERLLIIDTTSCSSHHQSLNDSSLSHDTEENFSKYTTKDLNICLHNQNVVENVQNDDFTDNHDTHVSQQSKICEFSEISNSNVESNPDAEINCNGDDDKNDHNANEKHNFVDQNLSQPSSDSIIYSDSSENKSNDTTRSVNARHSPSTQDDKIDHDIVRLDSKKFEVSFDSDGGAVRPDEDAIPKEPGLMTPEKDQNRKFKHERDETYAEITRNVSPCQIRSPPVVSTDTCDKETPSALSMCSSSPATLPSSSLSSSSSLPCTYGSIPSAPQHGFYDSLKFSESREKVFSDTQPSHQSFSCSEDQWMSAANSGINHGEANSAETRNSLETIKRKQKSLNDIIIRMLNDSSNKVHCSTESYATNLNATHMPPFVKSNSPCPQNADITQNLTTVVSHQTDNKNDLNEDADNDDDDNDNLEIQIDDDVEIEVADKNDAKPNDDDQSSRANISNGGGSFKYGDEKLHHISNFSQENDFQKQSSNFIQEPNRRNYQDTADYQTVKADKEHPRVDILEPSYLFPYDSRLYNVHLFEKFLPHAYHDYKTSSHFHESGHIGSRALCNPVVKDHYPHNQDEFESDAIDLTKNTRPNTTNSGFDNFLNMKNHEAYDERSYSSINGSEEFDKKQVQDSDRSVGNEEASFMEMNNNKIVCDNNLVSTNSPERKSYSIVSGDPEGKDYDENMKQNISKMEEDAMLKEGLKAMKNYSDDLYSLKEPISKSLNFSSYSGDMYHSNRDNSYSCHGYDYQNACSKSSKYSLMADMGNSFYAYYNNAHYNGAMNLYGGIGHCLAMTDKMQQSENKHVSSIEAEVLNLAKQDKSLKPSLDFQRSSGFKGDVNNVTEKDEIRSDSFVSNKAEQNVQASNFFPVQELQGINSLEDSVDDKIQTSNSPDIENMTSETAKCGNSVPDQMQINSNNSSMNGSDQSANDSKQFQSNQSSVSTEHHKEMGKTKSIWRDKYLAEDSSLHFTNFSSISRLEQCVSSINYDKPPVDKKERLKLSADVEKELHSFRMGLKMLGEPGIKFFDNKDDFICDQSPNTSGKNKKSGSNQKSNDSNIAECNIKSSKTKSKSNKESKSKKTHSSEVYQDFNANNFHINGPSHPQCPENYPNDLARHASRNEQLTFNNMGMNSTNQNDMNNLLANENGKKKRGRKKKDSNAINPNAENHFKTSESSNFSEHVHNYNMMNNHYQEYQDYYNNNLHPHFRQQQQHQQIPVGYPYVPQSDMISSSILKVPESHMSSGTSPAKKKQSGDCKRSKGKNDKSKSSEKHLRNVEKVPTLDNDDNDDIDDNESFLCNGTSLDIYLNEPKACQPSDQVEEKLGEETDLPFTFDADQKTFTCHFCSYQVKRKGQLMKHLGGHHVFVCTHCNAKCPDQRKLEEHLLEKHPTRCGRRLCKRCHVLFRLEELEQHEVECNGEKQGWSCDICDKKFRFLSAVKNHVAKWHKNEPSRFEMKAEDIIKKPKSKSHSEGSRNNKGIEYVDESTILDDIQIVDLPQLETSIDMNSFTGASSPNRDSSTDAGSGSSLALYKEKQAPEFAIYQENEISKSSIGNADDKKSRTFQCKLCPKFYRSMQSLKIHKQKKHGDYVDKQMELQRPTSRQSKMDAYSSEEIHHLETRNGCDYDAKQADRSDKSLLKNTSKEVVSTKELSGQDLDSVNHGSPSINFKEASSNDNTDEDASNEMPSSHLPLSDGWFQCTYESCSKKFRKLEQVQKHEERHPIDKIYKCDWPGCRKAYIHYANLYSHRSHHITAKPFVCNLCSSAYWQKCSLNSHKARVHGIKNPALVPGPKNDRQKIDRSFEACDDDSKTITSNISDSEANSFCDVEKSESGTISFTGLIQINHGNESEQLSDLNDKSADDNNYNTSSKKKCKLTVKENVSKKSKCNKLYSEKSKSKMSTNYIDSNESEEDLKPVNEVVPVSKEKPVSKSNEIKSSKVEMDKSEVSQASTCIQDHGSGKKKRGRKPKTTKLVEEIKVVEEKETPKTKKEEKPEHSSDFFKADGYKPFESRCVVEELLLTAKIPLSQHNLEDMTPLEVALNDLGAREVESCDDAFSGTEKTKTKRKIRTSLNYRKKSKLAKKGNQDVAIQPDQALVTSSTVLPAVINDEGTKTCNDNTEPSKTESHNLLACNLENKSESASDRIMFKELVVTRLPDQIMDLDDKMSDIVKSGLEFDSLSSETVANVNITKCDKFTIGNVYEFCESESEECIGSNKSSVKKKFINKKQEVKKLDPLSESRDMDDSDDNTSVDFKLSREGCKPPMTYLNRSKKRPHASFDSSSPVSMISEESMHHLKKKQKRKLKSESSENTLKKKQKRYSSNNQINTSFEAEENDSFALKKDESPIQASNRETMRDDKDDRAASQPTPAKRVSKRRKNEVEVLLEDTLSRPATADKKSSGRPSKRSELFNFDRSLVPKSEVKTSAESKKLDVKIVEQKMISNDKEENGALEDEVQNTKDVAALSEIKGNRTIQSFNKDSCIESSEDVMETQSQPIESRLAKKRKAESLVPMFYEDGLHMKEEKPPKKNLNLQPKTESVSAENSPEICSSGNVGDVRENPVCAPSEIKEDNIKNVAPTSNIQTYEQPIRTELVSIAENPLASGPNIILKLKIREVERYTPSLQSTQESEEKSESHTSEQLNDFNENSAADISTAESKQDIYKVPNKDMTEDTDSQLSLIDSLEYLRIAERAVAASENVPVTSHSTDNMESVSIDCRQAVPAVINNLDKQADHTYKEDDYCIEDGDDDGGFVKPSEPPSTWRNYDYDDTCYDHQSERKKFKGKSADDQEVDLNKRNLPNNEETDKLCHFPKNDPTGKESFCQDANEEDDEKRKKSEMPDEVTGSLSKNDDIPDSVSLRASLEEVEEKLYQPKNQIFDHSDVAYSDEQFRNGMESSRPISPFNHSKELSHPGSNRKDSKLSVDTLAEGQPYPNACSSSYFDYQTMAVKRSDPHPLSSLESLATLAPSAGLGGYFDSVVPPEKRLPNDLNKPPRSNNFHPEVPPPPPPHTPFPSNPYRNFPSYEADLALLSANRHKSYRYNERPFDPSLAYSYDRPDLHHPSYHMGSNFASPDSRFFSQFLQSADAVDQRYYMGQQGGFGDFQKGAVPPVPGDPKNKFTSTSFTSLLTGSPYSGLSDSYLSSLTPNISNPSLATNQLGNYGRSEGWANERPWTAAPPSTNDPSIQYQQHQQPSQQQHGSSRKQQQPPTNDYDAHAAKKTPSSSSSASVRGSGDPHFYNSYESSSPRLRNLATPGPLPSVAQSGHKRLEEAYRHAAAIMSSDYNQHHHPSLIQPTPGPATDVYGSADPMMNPAAFPSFNRYYYSAARDAVYRSQQRLAAMHHHHQQQQHNHNSSLSPFSNVNLAGFAAPGYPPDPFTPLPASTSGMPYSSKNHHYPSSRGGNSGGGKHHQNQIQPSASTGAPPPQTNSKSKSSKAVLPPLGLGGMAPSFDHLNSSNFLHQQNPAIPPDPYRQSVIYNMIPKYF